MKLLKQISEDEVIAEFLKAEINSKRFGQRIVEALKKKSKTVITNPNLENKKENDMKKVSKKWIWVAVIAVVTGVIFYLWLVQSQIIPCQPIPESALKSKFGYIANPGTWQILENGRERWNYVTWERAHLGFANWNTIEPKRGEYHWEDIDEYVKSAHEKGFQILFTIWPFTDWDQAICHSDRPENPMTGKPIYPGSPIDSFRFLAKRRGIPCDMQAYQEFLRRMVERYDGDGNQDMVGLRYPVKYWEIGNEPDEPFFEGSPQDYFNLLKVSYETIKGTDPNARVLIAAFANALREEPVDPWIEWKAGKEYCQEVFRLGAPNYFDIANYHGLDHLEVFRQFLEEQGAGEKPIWITEPGGIEKWVEVAKKENITLALLFTRVFENALQCGVERIFLGGPESIDQALHEAVLTIEKSVNPEGGLSPI